MHKSNLTFILLLQKACGSVRWAGFAGMKPHLLFLRNPVCDILKACPGTPADAGRTRGDTTAMPKRTFQPNRRHRSKTHGFRTRMKTKSGAAVLSRRRAKGRHKIAVSAGFRD